jgi:energy-coupling factor transporter ATP-binding protein EcfA2
VAIAAMMAARPKVLILDEPTSNLDPTATAAILRVIADIRQHEAITVIVIEQKLSYLRHLSPRGRFEPQVVRMEAGRIVPGGGQGAARAYVTLEVCTVGIRPREERFQADTAIAVRDLCFAYQSDVPVLRNVSMDIPRGQFVAVMGDNGAGKSTFLRCLLGLIKPASGTVTVLGLDTRHTPVSELARRVGFVFQNPDHQLFTETVWKEATFAARNFGLGAKYDALSMALLERSGLGDALQRHPYRLSYGQKRRLNLVSVLPCAQVLLLDEVLIGQDPANVAFLMGLLREAADSGVTVVSITHNPEATRRYAERVIFFEEGRPIVDAPPREAFAQLAERGYATYTVGERA